MRYLHVYRTQTGEVRAIAGDNRDWHGRKSCIVRTYLIWQDGKLTEIEARTAPEAVAS